MQLTPSVCIEAAMKKPHRQEATTPPQGRTPNAQTQMLIHPAVWCILLDETGRGNCCSAAACSMLPNQERQEPP